MHPSMHGLILTADNRQSTKLAVAANFSNYRLSQYTYGNQDSYRL